MTRQMRQDVRQRGTVLVLVVVVIVLMALLGAAYMQVARVQRLAIADPPRNIDLVLQSVINEIKLQLKRDLVDDQGLFLYETSPSFIEPYDYPWTSTANGTETVQDPVTGTNRTVLQPAADDRWLAATVPNTAGTNWPKITSLTRVFFESNNVGDRNSLENMATARPLNAGRYDTDVAINLLADASGDGIGDSQWERAPIPLMTGIEYFMAVRIVDQSALLNLLAATAVTSDGNNAFPSIDQSGSLRGYFPTSLDLTRLTQRRHTSWNSELSALFNNVRTNMSGTMPTPFGLNNLGTYPATGSYAANSRIDTWLNGTSIYGNLGSLGSRALPLLYRGGIHDPSHASVYDSPMPNVLGTPYDPSQPAPIANISRHYHGSNPGSQAINTFDSIRHMVTPVSGHGLYAPNHGNMHQGAHTLKTDLVYLHANDPQARADVFYDRLSKIFNLGSNYTGGDAGAAQFALNIQAYASPSNRPQASLTVGGTTYYPLTLLPFLREVYMQSRYEDADLYDADGNDGPDGAYETWQAINNSQAMAVEIGNPFDRAIPAADLNSRVRLVVMQGGTAVATYTFDGLTDLGTREKIVFLSNATNKAAPASRENGATDDLAADLSLTGGSDLTIETLADGTLAFNANGQAVSVELQVQTEGGTWVAYDRLEHAGMGFESEYPHNEDTNAAGYEPHMQKVMYRDGRALRYLTNNDLVPDSRPSLPQDTTTGPSNYDTTLDRLTRDDKVDSLGNPPTAHPLDTVQLPMANRPIFSVTELGWIMTVGYSTETEGTFPQKLDARPVEEWFLHFDAATDAANGLNHAQIVMDQFTTLSPRNDGFTDNNMSGTVDSPEEQFVPGTINLNTAPLHILTLSSPLPATVADNQALMQDIIAYREANNGIRSIGALWETLQNHSGINTDSGGNFDLYPMPEEGSPPAGPALYNDTDTAEAQQGLRLMQFLSQAYTTRSDIFAAFILVKGYTPNAGSGGVVQQGGSFVEQGRVIVVFSRAELLSGGDEVRVLGVYRYPN